MVYFSNEPCTKELLDFFADGLAFLAAETTKSLLDRFRPGPDVEFVLGDLPRNPRHVRGFPSERIEVHSEEVDERAFLFRIERRPDTERAAVVGDGHLLGILGRLERAGRALGRLGDLGVLGRRFCDELLGPNERLSELKALGIAFVCVLE